MKSFLVFCSLLLSTMSYAADLDYHVVKKLQLGGEGGWDYLTVDSVARRLYISRSTHVMVIDIETDKIVGNIADTPGVHGIAIAPELGRGFTSNGKANTATIFDLKTLRLLGHVKTGENPDAILYEPASKRVFNLMDVVRMLQRSKRPPVRFSVRLTLVVNRNLQRQTEKAGSM